MSFLRALKHHPYSCLVFATLALYGLEAISYRKESFPYASGGIGGLFFAFEIAAWFILAPGELLLDQLLGEGAVAGMGNPAFILAIAACTLIIAYPIELLVRRMITRLSRSSSRSHHP